MAVEMFSWPSLHEWMCRAWGSNSGPLACQANTLPIELPRPAAAVVTGLIITYRRYKRRLEKQRLIQEEHTGFTFTVFLSYSSLDGKGFLAIRRLLSLDAKFNVMCRNSAHVCCTCSLETHKLTAFNVRWQFLFQRAMPFRNFDYQLYVLFSVLCMRLTPIKQRNHAHN